MDDCISRQAAIRWVKTECNPYGKPTLDFESGKKVIEHLKQMPFAQPEPHWIPCSERLSDEEVLCCDTRGEMIIGYPYPDEESNIGFSAESDDVFMIDCVAWMPLPQPYKGD